MTRTLKLGLAGLDHLQGNQWFGGEWNPFFAVLWVMIVMYRAVVKLINTKFYILKLKLLVFKRLEKVFKVIKVARWKKRLCVLTMQKFWIFFSCHSVFTFSWTSFTTGQWSGATVSIQADIMGAVTWDSNYTPGVDFFGP